MSDTPRTDKEIFVAVARPDVDLEAVDADFARELLRENAALQVKFMFAESEIILLREDREELREENAALRRDSDRLDWLITKGPVEVLVTLSSDPVVARANIDREMEFPTA